MLFSPRKILALIASLPLTLSLAACFDADATINGQEGVPLSEIEQSGASPVELVLAGSDKVIISEGDAFTITVEGSEDAKSALRFVLDGDVLGITRDESVWDQTDQATIRVTLPLAPKELVITGSGSMETAILAKTAQISVLGSGEFTGGESTLDALDVNIAGSGSAALDKLTTSSLQINIGGSGSVTASGTAERLDINLGGSGGAQLDALKANDVEVAIAGSGSVQVQSDGAVDASIMGSGSVNVEGSATCTESAMGSGSLNCEGGTKTKNS